MKKFLTILALSLGLLATSTVVTQAVPVNWTANCDTCLVNRTQVVAPGDTLTIATGVYNAVPALTQTGTVGHVSIVRGTQTVTANTVINGSVFLNTLSLLNQSYITYKNCTFNAGILIQGDRATGSNYLTFDNCTFNGGSLIIQGGVHHLVFSNNHMTDIYCLHFTTYNALTGKYDLGADGSAKGFSDRVTDPTFVNNRITFLMPNTYPTLQASSDNHMIEFYGIFNLMWQANHTFFDYSAYNADEIQYMQAKYAQNLTFRDSYFNFSGHPTHANTPPTLPGVVPTTIYLYSQRDSVIGVNFLNDTLLTTAPYGQFWNMTGNQNFCRNFYMDSCLVNTKSALDGSEQTKTSGFNVQQTLPYMRIYNTVWRHWGDNVLSFSHQSDTLLVDHSTFEVSGFPQIGISGGHVINYDAVDNPVFHSIRNSILISDNINRTWSVVDIAPQNYNNNKVLLDYNLYYNPNHAGSNTSRIIHGPSGNDFDLLHWLSSSDNSGRYDQHSIEHDPLLSTHMNPIVPDTAYAAYPLYSGAFGTSSTGYSMGAAPLGSCNGPTFLTVTDRSGSPESTTVIFDEPSSYSLPMDHYVTRLYTTDQNPTDITDGSSVPQPSVVSPGTILTAKFATTSGTPYYFSLWAVDLWGRQSNVAYIKIANNGGGSGRIPSRLPN